MTKYLKCLKCKRIIGDLPAYEVSSAYPKNSGIWCEPCHSSAVKSIMKVCKNLRENRKESNALIDSKSF